MASIAHEGLGTIRPSMARAPMYSEFGADRWSHGATGPQIYIISPKKMVKTHPETKSEDNKVRQDLPRDQLGRPQLAANG